MSCAQLSVASSVDRATPFIRAPRARHVGCRCSRLASAQLSGDLEPVYATDRFYIRKIHSNDVPAIADVQCNSFHEPAPVFDSAIKSNFRAEVLDGLRSKLRMDPEIGIVLVAVPTDRGVSGTPVAVVEMFLAQDSRIRTAIAEAGLKSQAPSFYGLITSMAVAHEHRRQGCATALLEAVHVSLEDFETDWSVLHVHGDNHSARALYERVGYHNLGSDSAPWQRLLGGKDRTLMVRPRG
eukprot:jgi/Ulvmu1/9142/UM005_0240.1